MSDVLNVVSREETGTLRMRRMRKSGKIPAVLYGHGEACVNLTADEREVAAMIRHGSQVVKLQGACNESALVKQVQWDALGSAVLHLDLNRISESELVQVRLPIELKGDAPGTHHGGIISQVMHDIEILCPANQLPEKLELNINSLELDGTLSASDLVIPDAAQLAGSPDDLVVTCHAPAAVAEEDEEEAEAGAPAEPEVIGRKEEESSEDDS